MNKKYKGVLAIDFDGTVASTDYPKINGLITGSKKYINRLFKDGWYIVIWTCRYDDTKTKEFFKTEAQQFLDEKGVMYHCINEHCPRLIELYKNNTRKISADFYIDDKNIFGLPAWSKIYNHLKSLKNFKSCLRYEEEAF